MSTKITLSDIQAATEAKYGSLVIELGDHEVELRNVLRLSKAEREALKNIQSKQDEKDGEEVTEVDELAAVSSALRIAAATEGQFNKLSDALGEDLAQWVTVMGMWQEKTQLGEASPSQS